MLEIAIAAIIVALIFDFVNGFNDSAVISVGDSSTDLSMMVGESRFIGFNPARERALRSFEDAKVPIIESKDLRAIWPYLYPNETDFFTRS